MKNVTGKYKIENGSLKAETDVVLEKEDGRKIVIAREGQSVNLRVAKQWGFVEEKQEKKAASKSNKSKKAAENKSK